MEKVKMLKNVIEMSYNEIIVGEKEFYEIGVTSLQDIFKKLDICHKSFSNLVLLYNLSLGDCDELLQYSAKKNSETLKYFLGLTVTGF